MFNYKHTSNKLPHYLQSLPIQSKTETHHHTTRIQNDTHQPLSKHAMAKNYVCSDIFITINYSTNSMLDKIYIHSL